MAKITISQLESVLNSEGKKLAKKLLANKELVARIDAALLDPSITKIPWKEFKALDGNKENYAPTTTKDKHGGYCSIVFLNAKKGREAYMLGDIIKQGGKAKLKHAFNLDTGKHVALKIVRGITDDEEAAIIQKEEFYHEKDILRDLNRFEGDGAKENKQYLAQEFIYGKDLDDYINILREQVNQLDTKSLAGLGLYRTLLDILDLSLQKLSEMHGLGYIHRDLKLLNIMVSENYAAISETDSKVSGVLLVDFGGTNKENKPARATYGTSTFFSPELKSKSDEKYLHFTQMSDVYALGKSLEAAVELLSHPKMTVFFVKNESKLHMKEAFKALNAEVKEIIAEMQADDPVARISSKDASIKVQESLKKSGLFESATMGLKS